MKKLRQEEGDNEGKTKKSLRSARTLRRGDSSGGSRRRSGVKRNRKSRGEAVGERRCGIDGPNPPLGEESSKKYKFRYEKKKQISVREM